MNTSHKFKPGDVVVSSKTGIVYTIALVYILHPSVQPYYLCKDGTSFWCAAIDSYFFRVDSLEGTWYTL